MVTNHETEKEHEMDERRLQVSRLMLQGYSQREMAKELVSSQPTICRDVEFIRTQWATERFTNTEADKAQHVDLLKSVIREAFSEWERSKKPAKRKESGSNAQGSFDKTVRQGQTGNPAYLSKIMEAAKEIADTIGLHAPEKHAVTDSHGNDLSREEAAERVLDVVDGVLQSTPALVDRIGGNGKPMDSSRSNGSADGISKS